MLGELEEHFHFFEYLGWLYDDFKECRFILYIHGSETITIVIFNKKLNILDLGLFK